MVHQLGPPTFFVTFTSTEHLWVPWIDALHEPNHEPRHMPDKIEELQAIQIVELIHSDPLTCARYYNHRSAAF